MRAASSQTALIVPQWLICGAQRAMNKSSREENNTSNNINKLTIIMAETQKCSGGGKHGCKCVEAL